MHFIISDTHSDAAALEEAVKKAIALGSDEIWSAGDLCPDGFGMLTLIQTMPLPFVQVRGNCDSMYTYSALALPYPPMIISRMIEGGREVEMTHGDRIWEPMALEKGGIFITGHTHLPALYTDVEGIIHLNPGSISRPRNREGATYALINEEGIEVRRMRDDKLLLFQSLQPEA